MRRSQAVHIPRNYSHIVQLYHLGYLQQLKLTY